MIEGALERHDQALLAAVEAQGQGRVALALDLYEEALDHASALENRRRLTQLAYISEH